MFTTSANHLGMFASLLFASGRNGVGQAIVTQASVSKDSMQASLLIKLTLFESTTVDCIVEKDM